MPVYRHPKSWLVLAVAGAATALAWLSLVNPGMAGLIELCGENGVFAYVAPWNGGRLLGLAAMWSTMGIAMMVPCIAVALVASGWRWRESFGFFTGALCHALGYFGVVLPRVLAAAGLEWTLESIGLASGGSPPNHPLVSALLLGAGLAALLWQRRHRIGTMQGQGPALCGVHHALRQLPILLAMISIQLALGSMNLGAMALLSLAMLVGEYWPICRNRRTLFEVLPIVR
ncbi:hypothetical protein JP75_04200 [Devosia riboflavina]|uniref:Uncharacterized protein n=1 Tax=Devosia riboflavina TaxID=46914 RepID=A0A087M5M3_9HYPH|nr:hypothetical protein [Devosia riboflavina]KFL32176.1 hypothetical protein JP75_04200 [Devosia riboflavina]